MYRLMHPKKRIGQHLAHACIICCMLQVSGPTLAQDFEAGVAAYERGNYTEAESHLRPLAQQGDVDAQGVLGTMYYEQDDFQGALRWWTLAAEKGHPLAQYSLARLYHFGYGVTKDYSKAADLYERAAEQGIEFAQYAIGTLYFRGEGVMQDDRQAAKWLLMATRQGHRDAPFNLGLVYARNKGVPKDMQLAYMYLYIASQRGNMQAAELVVRARSEISDVQAEAAIKEAQSMLQ